MSATPKSKEKGGTKPAAAASKPPAPSSSKPAKSSGKPAAAPAKKGAAPPAPPPPPATVCFQGVERWLFFPMGYKHVLLVQNCLMILHLADQPPSSLRRSHEGQIGAALAQHVMNPDESVAMAQALECRVKENIDKFNRIHPDESFQESLYNTVIYLNTINTITIRPGPTTRLTIHLNDRSGGFLQWSKRVFHLEPGDGRSLEQTIQTLQTGLPQLVQVIA